MHLPLLHMHLPSAGKRYYYNHIHCAHQYHVVQGGKMAAQYDAAAEDRNMEFESGWEKVKTAAKGAVGGNKGVAK